MFGNILQRKLQASGMPGFHNLDPFSAGSMGMRAPMVADPQQQQQQQAPVHAPNTMVPATYTVQDPNAGTSFGQPSPSQPTNTATEGSSPIDEIMGKIYNKPSDAGVQPPQQQPQQQQQPAGLDLMNLPVDQIRKAASSMDFTTGLSEDTINKFQVNPETGQPNDLLGGLMEMMQHFGTNLYTSAMTGGAKVYGTALDQRFNNFSQKLPDMVNRHTVASAVQNKGYHKSLEPIVANAANAMLKNNPHVSPEEATQMIDQLVDALGQHLQQPASEEYQDNGLGNIFDL